MIVERGTHEELLRAAGLYAELHDIQFQSDEHLVAQPQA
jgi:ABC-type multidrug transport system fused ATPase/permease subunit